MFRTTFAQPDRQAVSISWDEVRDQLAKSFPKVGPLMDDAKAEFLAFASFPKAHWRKIWSTNPPLVNRPLGDTFAAAPGHSLCHLVTLHGDYLRHILAFGPDVKSAQLMLGIMSGMSDQRLKAGGIT